jgi:hypothetical protein
MTASQHVCIPSILSVPLGLADIYVSYLLLTPFGFLSHVFFVDGHLYSTYSRL